MLLDVTWCFLMFLLHLTVTFPWRLGRWAAHGCHSACSRNDAAALRRNGATQHRTLESAEPRICILRGLKLEREERNIPGTRSRTFSALHMGTIWYHMITNNWSMSYYWSFCLGMNGKKNRRYVLRYESGPIRSDTCIVLPQVPVKTRRVRSAPSKERKVDCGIRKRTACCLTRYIPNILQRSRAPH